MYAGAQRAHRFLAQAADRQHAAAQRDLTRHGNITVHRLPRQRGEHRCRDGDTGAGSVLGDGPLREVDMDVLRLVEVRRDAELLRPLAQARECRAAALLHHVAQVARELDLAAAIHHADLDGQNFAAHLGPRKAVHHADKILFRDAVLRDARRAEEVREVFLCNGDSLYSLCRQLHCRLAAELCDLTLERAHAALARVARDDRAQGSFVHAQI